MNALVFRPIEEVGPALIAEHPEPTLAAILSHVAAAYGISEAEVRTGEDELAAGARDEFLWLAEQLKAVSALACASYLGRPASDVWGSIANVERQRGSDIALRDRLEEACLTLHVEAVALAQLGLSPREASRPVDIARRCMVSRRAAGMASVEDMQVLASGYLALHSERDTAALRQDMEALRRDLSNACEAYAAAQREIMQLRAKAASIPPRLAPRSSRLDAALQDFITDSAALERASGPGERSARLRFEKTCSALAAAAESHFNITRTFK